MGYFLGLDFNLDVSGFLEVGYKLGWVICGLLVLSSDLGFHTSGP